MFSKDLNVKPQFKDKYYVYALCRPNGIPFYIGKGKNGRINDHFKNYSVNRSNSRKNLAIKKYGNKVRREILSYFDNEDSAYDYERWLISLYKLSDDGGLLYQYSYGDGDIYSKSFSKDASSKGAESKERVIPEDLVLEIYNMFFTDCLPTSEISEKTGVTYSYVSQLCCGHKDKKLYSDYILSGKIENKRNGKSVRRKKSSSNNISKISDDTLIEYYNLWFDNKMSISTIAVALKVSKDKLRDIFYGNDRKHLFENRPLPNKVRKLSDEDLKTILYEFYVNDRTNSYVSKMFNVSERRLRDIKACKANYSYLLEYKNKIMER